MIQNEANEVSPRPWLTLLRNSERALESQLKNTANFATILMPALAVK